MSALDRIDKKKIRDLLGKGWLTHDGMWFYHTYQEFGIEKANRLNKAAIKSLAPIEIERAKKALGFDGARIITFDDLKDFMFDVFEITLPGSVFKRFKFWSPEKNLFHWEWESGQCFAFKGMKQIGIIDGYDCGVMYRIECWLDAVGIEFSINPSIGKCTMHHIGSCAGNIRVVLKD